jgi:hypothetical protein
MLRQIDIKRGYFSSIHQRTMTSVDNEARRSAIERDKYLGKNIIHIKSQATCIQRLQITPKSSLDKQKNLLHNASHKCSILGHSHTTNQLVSARLKLAHFHFCCPMHPLVCPRGHDDECA